MLSGEAARQPTLFFQNVIIGGVFWTKFEHFLTKIRTLNFERSAPPTLASLAVQQKSFFRNCLFCARFLFLLKGKENFFAGLCSEQAGWRCFASARARRNSPHTPLPPRPRFRRLFFRRIWSAYFAKQNAPPELMLPLPQPSRAQATTRDSLKIHLQFSKN